jgi:alanine dehydrogenase
VNVKIGVVKEIKEHEYRVALTPAGVEELCKAGHAVLVQAGAGLGSGLDDEKYRAAGAKLLPDAAAVFGAADMVLKVKEPLAPEWPLLRRGQILFTYLHLAASRELTEAVVKTGAACFAYETLAQGGQLPLLEPMSEVAGRLAIQAGAKYLERPVGGTGILLGGVPGVPPAHVLVLGGGVVGKNAARMAAGLGATVTVLDINLKVLRYLDEILPPNCRTVYSTDMAVREYLAYADLVVGAVLIPGAAAPKLVKRADLALMRQGSVIVDVAVDQGGCIETCRPTTHEKPTFVVDGVVHYCVANMPGAVPRTSTFALTNATLPWVKRLAALGVRRAVEESPELESSANTLGGKLTYKAVADAFGMSCTSPKEAVRAIA